MPTIAKQYPEDALLQSTELDVINFSKVKTLDELFRERVRRSPNRIAYCQFDKLTQQWISASWSEVATQVERWQVAFNEEGLVKGDRVAICYRNSIEWVIFDQAALRLGLVVVPLYVADRADNISYVLENSGAKLMLINSEAQWKNISSCGDDLSAMKRVLIFEGEESGILKKTASWLPEHGQHYERGMSQANDLASIIYTSGTTGRPKGVMLSHLNLLSNTYNGMRSMALRPTDSMLSFLPLSHSLERTVGYYAPMMCGSRVTYNRSINELSNDLKLVKPTVIVSVPRIFERVYNKLNSNLANLSPFKKWMFKQTVDIGWQQFQFKQGMASWNLKLLCYPLLKRLVAEKIKQGLGGQLDYAIVGGAPLSFDVAKTFTALDICLLQGYGLTEASPVISVNTIQKNRLDSIGMLLRGVEAQIADNDELWVRGDSVMQGYWKNEQATKDVFEGEWLKTGDKASIDEQGFLRIIGRIKDILVLANGEKVPPSDIESAISRDVLFEQVLVVGEGKSFLTALIVVNKKNWKEIQQSEGLANAGLNDTVAMNFVLARIAGQMQEFPGYAKVRKVHLMFEEWLVEDNLLTPTLKLKRTNILAKYQTEIDKLYQGH